LSLGEAMMIPTRIYVGSVLPLARSGVLKGAAHITGGGLTQNTPRAVAAHLKPEFDWASWSLPPVFAWLQGQGGVELDEMRRTFNCGLGFVVIVAAKAAAAALSALLDAGETALVCGELRAAD
jgi:phosphoribosylformylglycinamidine cyclo-ligase/phosphoribosylamine--glycine ligase/phosphoribosylglycinamide formyltransferase/phosphoribosylformylglycinamidine cyclo-ligase